MWFKNLKIYQLTDDISLEDDALQSQLTTNAFRPCGKQETASMGWSNPLGSGASLYHAANGQFWVTLKKQERLLPSSVVNAELEDKIAEIESQTGTPVGKKQAQDLKQEIIHRLLPQAFTKNSLTHGFIAPKERLVMVDAGSDGKAETFLAVLRKSLGSLPVVPLARNSLVNQITEWLSGEGLPQDIELLEEAELKDPSEQGSIVRCKNQDLQAEEMQMHLQSGKLVHKIGIAWDETLTAVLQEDLAIKRIKFADVMREENDDIPKDDAAARMDADFALMSGELIRFSKRLSEIFSLDEE